MINDSAQPQATEEHILEEMPVVCVSSPSSPKAQLQSMSTQISGFLGRFVQALENLEQRLVRLEQRLESMDEKMAIQTSIEMIKRNEEEQMRAAYAQKAKEDEERFKTTIRPTMFS